MKGLKERVLFTITGHNEEISKEENEAAYKAHLKQHPENSEEHLPLNWLKIGFRIVQNSRISINFNHSFRIID